MPSWDFLPAWQCEGSSHGIWLPLEQAFSALALVTFWAILLGGGLSVHCRVFSHIPGPYPLELVATPLPPANL